MGQSFIGEIRMFGGNFAPAGWAFCSGQTMAIDQNTALYNLIGTTYGGDGVTTFNLPNLQSRVPIHAGTGSDGITYPLGQSAGVEQVTLTGQQLPIHNHAPLGQSGVGGQGPGNGVWAASLANQIYTDVAPAVNMNPAIILPSGGSQPHDNMMPFLVVSFIISLLGVFPSPN
jgi:microcystin-dependent protein